MGQYYWCLKHERVEEGAVCRSAQRLGPYNSPEAARDWHQRVEDRDESWQAEDERWHGQGEDDPDP